MCMCSSVTFLCIIPGDAERKMCMSMTVMTASKYEINHSPVHLIMSAAAMNLCEEVIYIFLPFFCSCHAFRAESILQSKEREKVGNE